MSQEEVEYNHGGTIIRQGDQGGHFFILLSGAVEVYKDDTLLTVLMFPGTIFGEMADILNKPRTCTVKAKGSVRIARIKSQPMEELVKTQPDVVIKILKTLATRLERTTQKLTDQTKDSPMWAVEGKKPLA